MTPCNGSPVSGESCVASDSQLTEIDFSRELERWGKEFTGRQRLFDLVDTTLRRERDQLIVLTGEPGAGKSAFAAQLPQRRGDVCAFHFCIDGRIATVTPGTIFRSIASQLTKRLPGYSNAVFQALHVRRSVSVNIQVGRLEAGGSVAGLMLNTLATSSADEDLELLLRSPLAAIGSPPAQAVILIDGLDEAVRHGGNSNLVALLSKLGDLPAWVRLIYTTQPTAAVLRYLEYLRPRMISIDDATTSEDIHRYVDARISSAAFAAKPKAGRGTADLPAVIAARAENNFLFAKLLLDDVESGAQSVEDLDVLPSSLDEVYRRYLTRACAENWHELHKRVLGKLAVSQEPLTEADLARLSGISRGLVRRSLGIVDRFLHSTEDGKTRSYRLYHNSFKTFLLDSERAGYFWCDPQEEHSQIAAVYLAAHQRPSEWDSYGVKHVPWHLAHSKGAPGLRDLLRDYRWIVARLNVSTLQEVLADYDLVETDADLRSITSTLRLSAAALAADAKQLWNQFYARTMTTGNPVTNFPAAPDGSWIRPLGPSMRQANDSLAWTLRGHSKSVRRMVVHPESGVLITGDVEGVVRFWDIARGVEVRPPFLCEGLADSADPLEFSSDGNEVAAADRAGNVTVYALATGEIVHRFKHPEVTDLALSIERSWLLTSSPNERGMRIWDRRSWSWKLVAPYGFAVCFIPGTTLIASRSHRILRILDFVTGKVEHEIEFKGASIDGDPVVASRDGRFVASSGGDDITILDLKDGSCKHMQIPDRVATISTLQFNADATRIVGGSRGNRNNRGYEVRIWDLAAVRCISTFHGHREAVTCLAISKDEQYVVSAGYDRKLLVWNLHGSQNESRVHQNRVNDLVVTSSGTRAVTGSEDGDLIEWNIGDRTVESTTNLTLPIEHLAVSQQGDLAVTAHRYYNGQFGSEFDSSVKVLRPHKGKPITLVGYSGDLRKQHYESAQFNGDGRQLILARQQDESDQYDVGRLEIWSIEKRQILRAVPYTGARLNTMLLLPNSFQLLTASTELAVWDLADTNPSPVVLGSVEGGVASMALSPDGRRLAVGRFDGSIELWNLDTRNAVQIIAAHDGTVEGIAFLDSAGDLVSAGWDGCLKVWQGNKLQALFVGDDPLTALGITPDASTLVVGDAHGRVHFLQFIKGSSPEGA